MNDNVNKAERDLLARAARNERIEISELMSAAFPGAKVTETDSAIIYDLTNL